MKSLAIILCNDMHMDIANANTLLNYIKNNGRYEVVCDYTIADVVIVITCAFGPNKMNSVRIIADICINCKKDAQIILSGCLVKLNRNELEAIPGVRVKGYEELLHMFGKENKKTDNLLPQNKVIISEGCLHKCSYCVYPQIANKYKSKKMEDILEEVKALYETETSIYITGALETSDYGIDLYGKRSFAELLNKIVNQYPDCNYVLGWFHPSGLTKEVISIISENPNIVEIMLHIQHVNKSILKNMNRPTIEDMEEKIQKLKNARPDLIISTEVIVGFPGEGEEEFAELIDFLNKGYFDDIGVASYEPVIGTKAAQMENQIPSEVKTKRMSIIKNFFGATCYYADENSRNSIIEEYLMAIDVITKMPKNILKDRQKYNMISGTDTDCKFEKFEECLSEAFECVKNSRTDFDFEKNKKYLEGKYTSEARKLFLNIILQSDIKEALKKKAISLL